MPSQPRRAPVVDGPTPCSAWTLERKLLRAYDALLHQELAGCYPAAARKARAEQLLGGNLAATQRRHAEERLSQALREVISELEPGDEQAGLQQLLLGPDRSLLPEADPLAIVGYLVKMERWHNHHQKDPRLKVNDDELCRAAGIGRLARADPGNFQAKKVPLVRLGPPLVLEPYRPVLRTAKRRAARRGKRDYTRRALVRYPQLAFEFPGGGVTVAAL